MLIWKGVDEMGKKQPLLIYNQRYLDFRNESSESRSKQTRDTMAYLLRKDAIAGADQSKQQIQTKLPSDFIVESDQKSVMLNYGSYRPGSTGAFNPSGMLDRSGIEAIKHEMEEYRGIQWNGVFSLPDYETAARLKLVTVDDYQRLLTSVMPKYFTSQQLQPENMHWVAMHHINTKHPHCHILFWEREATKNRGNFQKGFERTFKQLVAKELNLYHEIKTELWQLDCFEKNIRTDLKVMINEQNPWLEDQLLRIVDELPKKGRIQYRANNCDAIRPLVDEVVSYCLQTYLQSAYQTYKQTQLKIIEFDQTLYGEADSDWQQRKQAELYERLGNQLLTAAKVIQAELLTIKKRDSFPDLLHQKFTETTSARALKLRLFMRLAKELNYANDEIITTLHQQFRLTENEQALIREQLKKESSPLSVDELEIFVKLLSQPPRINQQSITQRYVQSHRQFRGRVVQGIVNQFAHTLKQLHYEQENEREKLEAEIAHQFNSLHELERE